MRASPARMSVETASGWSDDDGGAGVTGREGDLCDLGWVGGEFGIGGGGGSGGDGDGEVVVNFA